MNYRLWLTLSAAWLALSTQAQYRVRHYTLQDGLGNGGAYYLLKDSKRYLWFLSQDGITRFDGTRFVNYAPSTEPPDQNQSRPGPTGNTGNGLAETPNGDLWFGTEQCLNHYVRATNRFKTVFARDRNGKPIRTMTHVIDADSQEVWYINEAQGLMSFNWRTGRSKLHSSLLRHNPAHDIQYIKHRRESAEIWLLLPDNGVVCYNYRTKQSRSFFSSRTDNQAGAPRPFSTLYLASNGLVWLAYTDVLIALNPATGDSQTYPVPTAIGTSIPTAIVPDQRGQLWVPSGNAGIYIFGLAQRGWVASLHHNPYDPNSIASEAIPELLIDEENIVWCNADPAGLDQLIPDIHGVRHYNNDSLRQPTLSDHTVMQIEEDRHGQIWIGTYLNGIDVLNPKTDQIRHYAVSNEPGALPSKVIETLYKDRQKRIWVGSGRNDLSWYDETSDRFVRVTGAGSDSLPAGGRIYQLAERDDGQFFVSTLKGLYLLNPATNRFRLLADQDAWFTRALYYDQKRRWLFAGRRLHDLVCYEDLGNQIRVRYTALPAVSVYDISPDTDTSRLWVATLQGLYLLQAKDGKILRHWTERDGLPHHVVYSCLPDQAGNRWISTNRGIAVLNPHTGQIRRVHSIPPTEFNGNSFLKAQSGEFYFGSTIGLFRFDPLKQTARPHALSVALTGLLINDQPIQPDSNVTELNTLKLLPQQYTVTLQFGAIDYVSQGMNRYRYRLTGYDQDWVESGIVNTARYVNLPAGQYTFEVLAADAEGRWTPSARRLVVTVVPPFWQKSWFVALLVFLTGLIGYVSFRTYLVGQLRRQRREFKLQAVSQEAERERIARDLHDHIGPDLVALKLQLEAASEDVETEPTRLVLERTIEQADRIITDLRQISHALMPTGLQQQGLAMTLSKFVSQLNGGSGKPEINFTHALDEPLPESHQQALLQIAKELINNVLKHAQATVIDVELYEQNNEVFLTVSDNGRGYDPRVTSPATGIGLRNVRKTVNRLQGQFTILAKPTGGMSHQVVIKNKLIAPRRSSKSTGQP
ncbi:hypothetical protein HNV11_19315 [Spirosoma taeanense]|uniref:Histidine kinase domain-containing protein n=1 Tax=Spirosoma taeanense TaxID=2735870 RepID=A0A6M5YEG8_9BACT|nr:sensor histidine kinase [Spirosoma taeanense]QJW91372.1 hypothetical protein HNV11_19315 [Spirosoma taeanense]